MRCGGALARFAGCALLAGCVAAPRLQGPMPVRNQHPAQLTVLHLPPASAAVLPAGAAAARLDSAYSSLFLDGVGSGGRSWRMDGEYLRTALAARLGLGADLELGVELPFAHASGGFLDHFFIDFHDTLGFPDQGRKATPVDQFGIEAQRDGTTIWQVERHGLELLDVPLALTWQVSDPGRGLGVALRGGIELPTGNDARGYGNGQPDVGLGILLEHHALGCGWYGHLQHTFAGTPAQARAADFHFADVTSAGLAAEMPLADGATALLQVEWETSTLRELRIPVASRQQLLLWGGLRFDAGGGWDLELGFGEDLLGLVSPDFTAWLSLAWSPGGLGRKR